MADIQPRTKTAKAKVAKQKFKKKRADIQNFASLPTSAKWDVLAELLPQIVGLLEKEGES